MIKNRSILRSHYFATKEIASKEFKAQSITRFMKAIAFFYFDFLVKT